MEHELLQLKQAMLDALRLARELDEVEHVVAMFLGRNGSITRLLKGLPALPLDQRKPLGQAANAIRHELDVAVRGRRSALTSARPVDPSLPGIRPERGHLHPLTQFTRQVIGVMRSLGYDVHEGPELERDWYNFEGLNIPPDHPSRDMQDTFFVRDHPELVLRTHSSTVQLRSLQHRPPPLKMVEIGRVYRHEATDASHESMFSQIDGVAIDRHLTMAHLVTTLKTFFRLLYGPQVKLRIRPSYFPFVEPGIEVDMQWTVNGKTRWLELLGAGMIHPNVIKAMKLDPSEWKGFAFGMGLDRLVILEEGVPDIRYFYNGDLEFLKQF
ncbi:MAG: phenylalanine--tRNA ligase subunit alpha [Candidatus Kerfeldbacteria bacterium]|nr:phenylalanine--tRNA ligase subunit alpha [Candidatus Kerfeldbacteria bacterium]